MDLAKWKPAKSKALDTYETRGAVVMAKYHVNKAGEPGKCEAQNGGCPFGGPAEHFTSRAAAQEAYEASQTTFQEKTPSTSLPKNSEALIEAARKAVTRAQERLNKAFDKTDQLEAYWSEAPALSKEGKELREARLRLDRLKGSLQKAKDNHERLKREAVEGPKPANFTGKHRVPHDFRGGQHGEQAFYDHGNHRVTELRNGRYGLTTTWNTTLLASHEFDSFEKAEKFIRRQDKLQERRNPKPTPPLTY